MSDIQKTTERIQQALCKAEKDLEKIQFDMAVNQKEIQELQKIIMDVRSKQTRFLQQIEITQKQQFAKEGEIQALKSLLAA